MREEAAKRRGKNLPTAIAPDRQRSRLANGRQGERLPLTESRKDSLLLLPDFSSLKSAPQGVPIPYPKRRNPHLTRPDIRAADPRYVFAEGIEVGAV